MKPFVNKSLFVVSFLLVCNLFFSSCHKDNNNPAAASIPLVASISDYNSNGIINYQQSFKHDAQGRLIKIIEDNGYTSTVKYSKGIITLLSYHDDQLTETMNVLLNNKGLMVSFTMEDASQTATIEYDDNNYRKSSLNVDDVSESTTTFTVADGNYVTTLNSRTLKTTKSAAIKEFDYQKHSTPWSNLSNKIISQSRNLSGMMDYTERIEDLFYTDHINTIDFENMGISFEGKQNKNPIKQSTSTYYNVDNGIESTDITNYTYEYDTKGRITKQVTDNGNYTVYTYVD